MAPPLAITSRSLPGRPALDVAFSRALLDLVAEGAAPATLRLYRPDDVLAFSSLDAASPRLPAALAAARAAGFAPALRLAGGRAAVFHRETLAFAWTLPAAESRAGIRERFDAAAALCAGALRRLGVDARVGAVPREYCPGPHSVNARGRRKLVGIGQRVVRGAAHVGGVVVVRDSARVRAALEPVYSALGLDWDPASAGSIEDEIGRASHEAVVEALRAELAERFELIPSDEALLDTALARAARFEPRYAFKPA